MMVFSKQTSDTKLSKLKEDLHIAHISLSDFIESAKPGKLLTLGEVSKLNEELQAQHEALRCIGDLVISSLENSGATTEAKIFYDYLIQINIQRQALTQSLQLRSKELTLNSSYSVGGEPSLEQRSKPSRKKDMPLGSMQQDANSLKDNFSKTSSKSKRSHPGSSLHSPSKHGSSQCCHYESHHSHSSHSVGCRSKIMTSEASSRCTSLSPTKMVIDLNEDISVLLAQITIAKSKFNNRRRSRSRSSASSDRNLKNSYVEAWIEQISQHHNDQESFCSQAASRNAAPLHSILANPMKSESPLSSPVVGFNSKTSPVVDGSLRPMLIDNLKREPGQVFTGEAYLFQRWFDNLSRRMERLAVQPIDAIQILRSHTSGEPRRLIDSILVTKRQNSAVRLADIISELKTRFGSSERVARSLLDQLMLASDIKGSKGDPTVGPKLRQFSDICSTIHHMIEYTPELQFLKSDMGLSSVVEKLPFFVIEAWREIRADYRELDGSSPDFSRFCEFIRRLSDIECDLFGTPSFKCMTGVPTRSNPKPQWFPYMSSANQLSGCILHNGAQHETGSCQTVRKMQTKQKKEFIRNNKLCYRCLGAHMANQCAEKVSCSDCGANNHSTVAHLD